MRLLFRAVVARRIGAMRGQQMSSNETASGAGGGEVPPQLALCVFKRWQVANPNGRPQGSAPLPAGFVLLGHARL